MDPARIDPLTDASTPAGAAREVRWASLRYFGIYRLVVASVFLVAVLIYRGSLTFGSENLRLFTLVAAGYWAFAALSHLNRGSGFGNFDLRLTLQVLADILALTLLMYASGGYRSGLAFMMLIVLAAAGLIGQGRLVVFYAAAAALAVLVEQSYRFLLLRGDTSDFVPVAITSAGFFAVALISRLVGQRVMANEALAVRRGAELKDQMRINERVIRDMQDGALVLDPNGRLRLWNPRAEALLGMRFEAGIAVDQIATGLQSELAGPHLAAERTLPLRSNDGVRELSARIVPASERGDVLVYVEDLGRVQEQARELKLAALGRLTANIAHEIRNPLSSITHAAELLREEKRAETQIRLTRIINDNAQRIERLVRDVLELGRRDRVQPEDIRLVGFINGFLDELALQHDDVAARVAVDCPVDLAIRCDRIHLGQILGNLVGNALRYCTNQPGAVKLQALPGAPHTAAAGRIEMHIIDDGGGVPDTLRGQIFEPFVTTHSQGTGLGLYIARELAAANKAELELLDNAPGAHFRLIFQPADE